MKWPQSLTSVDNRSAHTDNTRTELSHPEVRTWLRTDGEPFVRVGLTVGNMWNTQIGHFEGSLKKLLFRGVVRLQGNHTDGVSSEG